MKLLQKDSVKKRNYLYYYYQYLLLQITNRLVQDILGGIIDNQISIDNNSINDNEVIFDAFTVLCNKIFQKTKNMSDINDEDENIVQDENVNPIEEVNLAKKKLLKSV